MRGSSGRKPFSVYHQKKIKSIFLQIKFLISTRIHPEDTKDLRKASRKIRNIPIILNNARLVQKKD